MILSPEKQVLEYTARGWWGDRTLIDLFLDNVEHSADAMAVVDPPNRAALTPGEPLRLTYAQAKTATDRLADALLEAGVGKDDVVMVQLPNIVELVVTYLACARIGAILSPLPVQFRTHELRHVIGLTEPKVFITTTSFGEHDYVADGAEPAAGVSQRAARHRPGRRAARRRRLAGRYPEHRDRYEPRGRPRGREPIISQRCLHHLLDVGHGSRAERGAAQPQSVDRDRLCDRGRGRSARRRRLAEPLPAGQHVGHRRDARALAADARQAGDASPAGPAGLSGADGRRGDRLHGRAARPAQSPAAAARACWRTPT